MNILIVTHKTIPSKGGIQIASFEQAKIASKLENDVRILSSTYGKNLKSECTDGIHIQRIYANHFFEKMLKIPYPIFSPRLLSGLYDAIKWADVVNIHGMLYISSFFASLISFILRKPVVLTEHVGIINTKNSLLNFIEKFLFYSIGNLVISLSSSISVCNKKVGNTLKKRKIVFIPNGVDSNFFSPINESKKTKLRNHYQLPLDKKLLLYVGRITPKKGIDLCLNVLDNDQIIVVIGEGQLENSMFANDKRVIFKGEKSRDYVRDLMRISDLFILPSEGEGFPLVILEAMACGLPVITTDHPGYRDYFDSGCVVFINKSIRSLKIAVKELLSDNDIIIKMAYKARSEVVKKYTWDIHAKRYLEIYNNVRR